jgi:tetratricopeptide (TPR) repeat protein
MAAHALGRSLESPVSIPAKSENQAALASRPVCLPESLPVLFLIFALSISLAGCTGFRAARLYQEGTEALNAGDSELAIIRLGEAEQLEPEASEIHNHLGLAYAAAGQHEQALSAFQKAVDLDCSNAAANHNLSAAQAAILSGRVLAKTEPEGETSDER